MVRVDKIRDLFGVEVPQRQGLNIVEACEAMRRRERIRDAGGQFRPRRTRTRPHGSSVAAPAPDGSDTHQAEPQRDRAWRGILHPTLSRPLSRWRTAPAACMLPAGRAIRPVRICCRMRCKGPGRLTGAFFWPQTKLIGRGPRLRPPAGCGSCPSLIASSTIAWYAKSSRLSFHLPPPSLVSEHLGGPGRQVNASDRQSVVTPQDRAWQSSL
jgi:hypothetical protein